MKTVARGSASKIDYLSIIEAAYNEPGTDEDWALGIAEAGQRLDLGKGVYVWTYDVSIAGAHKLGVYAQAGGHCSLEANTREFVKETSPEVAAVLFPPGPPVDTLRRVFGRIPPTEGMKTAMQGAAVGDAIAVRGHNLNGRGVMLAAAAVGDAKLPPRVVAALTRVAPHLSAAFRLRFGEISRTAENADAIFTANGRLEHVHPNIPGRAAKQLKMAAALRIAASAVRADSEQAICLWQALIGGWWSIIDHTDKDGKRFILAKRNQPGTHDPAALTQPERLVLAYASWGHSNKLIAYETGYSPAAVSVTLKSLMRKLRVKSRTELALLCVRMLGNNNSVGLQPKEVPAAGTAVMGPSK